MESAETFYRITLPEVPEANYLIKVLNGIVAYAPPIASWAVGKVIGEFIKWVELSGGITERVN